MPIYEYQCDKCHHHLEAMEKMGDKPLRECPECGRHTLRRLVSAPRFRLSGSGWYETDFKSDGERKRNLVEKEQGDAAPSATATGDTAAATTPAPSPAPAPAKEGAPAESTSRRRTATAVAKPATAKTASKPKPKTRAAARPAARKSVRKR
jgi:putative FmdB family regulatory protein